MPILTPEERVGTTIAAKYKLERILARGGMGTVYVGQHEWTHRPVAVKVLNYEHARRPEIVQRFLQEARAATTLRHPHVVDVLDMGEADDGCAYLVLELLEGRTLKERLREGPIGLPELVDHLAPVMDALAVAHEKGVIHRDLKPDNIFLAEDHGALVPKLLDFGIAKVLGGDASQTGTGVMIGTPQYMAPEQVRGDREVGPAADVWSLGVVLFAALSGRLPFQGDSPATTIAKVLVEEPPPLRSVAPRVGPAVAAIVDRALRRDPAERHASILAMKEALLAVRDGAPEEEEETTEDDARRALPSTLPSTLPSLPTVELSSLEEAEEESAKTIATPAPELAPPSVASAAPEPIRPEPAAPEPELPESVPATQLLPRAVGWAVAGTAGALALLGSFVLIAWALSPSDEPAPSAQSRPQAASPPAVRDAGPGRELVETARDAPEPPAVEPTPTAPTDTTESPTSPTAEPGAGRPAGDPAPPDGDRARRDRDGRDAPVTPVVPQPVTPAPPAGRPSEDRTDRPTTPQRGTGGALILR